MMLWQVDGARYSCLAQAVLEGDSGERQQTASSSAKTKRKVTHHSILHVFQLSLGYISQL